ncbi:hypothetical protein ACFSL6_17780 [Paenibacillus thailandensis]|uniref:Uncharacterized protein n=1 Tax=Paenibacillus thailandensis TaxID=393250 RepID=A0ABW5QT75_9BACL
MNPTRYDLKNNADFFYAVYCGKTVYYVSASRIGCGRTDLYTDDYVVIDGEYFSRKDCEFFVDA